MLLAYIIISYDRLKPIEVIYDSSKILNSSSFIDNFKIIY